MKPLKLVVFYGSVRSKRQGIKAARFIVDQCEKRGHEVTLLDAAELELPLLDKMYKEYGAGEAPAALQRMAAAIIPADAHIIVTGEYNHNAPPGLTNLLDHFLDEFFHRPSAIVSYSMGPFGGVRAAVAMRPMLAELGMSSIPSVLPISRVHKTFDEDGNLLDDSYTRRTAKFLDEVEWYANALRCAREADAAADGRPRASCEGNDAIKAKSAG